MNSLIMFMLASATSASASSANTSSGEVTHEAMAAVVTSVAEDSLGVADSPEHLNEFVVTGTRTRRLLKDTPVQTRLITAEDIRRTDATNVRDLLQQEIPSVEFTYAMDQQVHMNFGGFGGLGVLFLVDGERLAGETMDDVDFSRLEMSGIGSVEIVRGASSALYGSSAGGGVINVLSAEPTRPWQINASARIGRHLEQRYNLSLGNRIGHVNNTLSVSATSMKTFELTNAPDPQASVASQVVGYRTFSAKDRLVYTPLEGLKLTARAGYFFRQVPIDVNMPRRYRDYSAGARATWNISSNDDIEMAYSFDQYDKSDLNRLRNVDVRAYSNVQNSTRLLYNHTFANKHTLTLGGDYMYDYLMNVKLEGAHRRRQSADLFAQIDYAISPKFEAVGTLRYDYYDLGTKSHVTPKLSVCYRPTRRLNARLSYGMGYRVPSLKEMYYDFDMAGIWIVKGNPDLKPEHSHGVNASLDWTKDGYNVTAMAFYNNVTNKIATSLPYFLPGDDKQLYLDYINLAHLDVAGCELSAGKRWTNGLGARLTYSYTHEDTGKDKDGKQLASQYLPARPHAMTAKLDYKRNFSTVWELNTTLHAKWLSNVSNQEYVNYYDISMGMRDVTYPGYVMCKLSATATYNQKYSFTLTLDNLLNYRPRYYYLNSPMTDGLNLKAAITITLD